MNPCKISSAGNFLQQLAEGCGIMLSALTILLLWIGLKADAQIWSPNTQDNASDVSIVMYPQNGLKPLATIRADKIYTDYERHGFFRIGLLPIPVAESVDIVLDSASSLTNVLLSLNGWDQPSVGVKRLELRNLEIKLSGETQPRLTAAMARVGPNDVLELSKVSLPAPFGHQTIIPKAQLQTKGSSAGRLRWNCNGETLELSIFEPQSAKIP